MRKPYTIRACAAPAVRISPRLGGDAEVAGGAAGVVVARGSADLRRAVADVIVVERVALEWEGMIDGKNKFCFMDFGLKTVAIDIWAFSGVGVGTGFSPITVTVSEKQLHRGLFDNLYLMLVMGSGL